MNTPRVTPDLAGITRSDTAQVIAPVVDLCRSPDGPRDRQLIYGDVLTILSVHSDWRYVSAQKDGYTGYVKAIALGPPTTATHSVTAPATHAYRTADFKSPEQANLTFGSHITALSQDDHYVETQHGFIPKQHLAASPHHFDDPATVAALFLGTPYLWGGNSRSGIDCSGLVQAALLACGIRCPGDSAQQQELGAPTNQSYNRNDLLFWKGHVALVTDPDTLIHANAGAMATVYEPIKDAVTRIEDQGDGPITAHRRL